MENRKIIFFDGVCVLCNSFADFVIKYDCNNEFALSTLQGDKASELLSSDLTEHLSTVVLYDEGRVYTHSEAAIKVFSKLSLPFRFSIVFLLVPRFIRDAIYLFVSRNRYTLFGKRKSCRIPTELEKRKFVP